MNEILKKIGNLGIVPVVKIKDVKDALPLGRALIAGDLPIAEITFRTDCARDAIKRLSEELPDLLIGAGTVLNIDQVKSAIDAGAKFIVSPGFNPKVVEYCVSNNIPITPGCNNPTNIEMALEYGLSVVKFFPAEASGGMTALKAISAPYGMIRFIPTGGINAKNLNSYLSFNKILACGGSWMVSQDLISSGNFDEITRLTKEAVGIMLGFEIGHVGINMQGQESSMNLSENLSSMFGMPLKKGNSSNFIGSAIEVNNSVGLGENGHIAMKTNNIYRAIAYLEENGVQVDISTAKGPEGAMAAVYLKGNYGGFAIHLLQK